MLKSMFKGFFIGNPVYSCPENYDAIDLALTVRLASVAVFIGC